MGIRGSNAGSNVQTNILIKSMRTMFYKLLQYDGTYFIIVLKKNLNVRECTSLYRARTKDTRGKTKE